MEWDNLIMIAAAVLVVLLGVWLLIIAVRAKHPEHLNSPAFRRPPKVRMYEAAEGRIDRLREKTFAELEQLPVREDRKQLSRRKRKYCVTTTKRRLESGALHFTVTARELSWVRPWTRAQLEETFHPDHLPRKPISPAVDTVI